MFSIATTCRHLVLGTSLAFSILASVCHGADSVDWTKDGLFTSGVEGPVVDSQGNLYAVNYQQQGTIGKISPEGNPSLFLTLPNNSIGNGLRFDSNGDLLVADYVNHNILKVDMQSKAIEVYAHQPQMHQPNDIAISDKGMLYASDPDWQNSNGQLWMIDPSGKTHLLESNMGTTNGIEVSANGRYLFVNESVQRKVWRYELNQQGRTTNKTLFHHFPDHGLDGMRSDIHGNLYVARYGAGEIAVLSAHGEVMTSYKLKGQFPTNVAFGGCAGKTLYVTMQKRGAIEKLRVNYPGRAVKLPLSSCDKGSN